MPSDSEGRNIGGPVEADAHAVRLKDVRKRFPVGKSWSEALRFRKTPFLDVLKGLDLRLRKGEIYGLVGINGAGKSTILRLISGLLIPDAGSVRTLGCSPADDDDVRGRIGVILPNERSFFYRLGLRRNLEFFAVMNGLSKSEAARRALSAMRRVELEHKRETPFRELSDGMKQRAAVARSLLWPTDLLLADEATRSLDPKSAELVRDLFREKARGGGSVLTISHSLEEIGGLCDRMGLLSGGRIVLEGRPADAAEEIRRRLFASETDA